MSRGTPVWQHLAARSRPGVTPSGKVDTGRQVGKRVSGRSPEGCFAQQRFASKRSPPRVSRPRRRSPPPFEQWLIFPFRRAHSTRRRVAPVLRSTSIQYPTGRPSEFPSDTPACPRTDVRHRGRDTSGREGQDPLIPIYLSVTKPGGKGQQNGTNYKHATPEV